MQCKPISEFIYCHAFAPVCRLTSLLGCGTRTNIGLCKWNGCVSHSWTCGSQSSGRVKICSKNTDVLCQSDSVSEGWSSRIQVQHLDFFPFYFCFIFSSLERVISTKGKCNNCVLSPELDAEQAHSGWGHPGCKVENTLGSELGNANAKHWVGLSRGKTSGEVPSISSCQIRGGWACGVHITSRGLRSRCARPTDCHKLPVSGGGESADNSHKYGLSGSRKGHPGALQPGWVMGSQPRLGLDWPILWGRVVVMCMKWVWIPVTISKFQSC